MQSKKKLRYIFIAYWFLVTYIIACLIWWFIVLLNQNKEISNLKGHQLIKNNFSYSEDLKKIKNAEKRKTAQYTGEGSIFLLLIMAGAIFLYRAVRKQLKTNQEQQNFMIAITHELKTPIAIAKLNLETLQKRKLDESQQQKLIHSALQESNRLNSLCNNLLFSSQIEAGGYKITHEAVNFSSLIISCVNDFKNRFPDRKFVLLINDDIYVKGDSLLLEIAVNNLIDNAIKYAAKETNITLVLSKNDTSVLLQVKMRVRELQMLKKKKYFINFIELEVLLQKQQKVQD